MRLVQLIEEGLQRMASHVSPATLSTTARDALQLEQFRCSDYRTMAAELRRVFPGSHEEIRLSSLPLARSVASDSAPQYILRTLRAWGDVDPAEAAELDRLYADMDLFLLEAEQAGALQQAYLVGVFPGLFGPEPMLFLPYQVAKLRFSSPFDAARGDVSRATRVELLVPTPAPDDLLQHWELGQLWYARLVLTPTEAYIEWPDGARRGVFGDEADHTNPLGRVPLVGTRRVKPAEAHTWLPMHAEDVRSCQIGVNLAISDWELLVREHSVPSLWASGDNAKAMAGGAKKVGKIGILPPSVELTQYPGVVDISQYVRATETTLYYLQNWRKTRPEAFQGSIVTGAARRADAEGFVEEREKQEGRLRILERDLVRLMVDVANLMPRALRLTVPDLRVTYRYVRTPENALQEAQSMAVLAELGLRDVVLEVAKEEGVTPETAQTLLVERLKRRRDLLASVAADAGARPGLDKLDKSVPQSEPPTPDPEA